MSIALLCYTSDKHNISRKCKTAENHRSSFLSSITVVQFVMIPMEIATHKNHTCGGRHDTTMPSGCRHPDTITFRSEPSALSEKISPLLKSRTNKRPVVDLLPDVTCFGSETCRSASNRSGLDC